MHGTVRKIKKNPSNKRFSLAQRQVQKYSRALPAAGAYLISGRRPLEPIATIDLSPDNSTILTSTRIKKKSKHHQNVPRSSSPVTVVGFPNGFPKGLHIVGNKAPDPVKILDPLPNTQGHKGNWEDSGSLGFESNVDTSVTKASPPSKEVGGHNNQGRGSISSIGEDSPRTKIRNQSRGSQRKSAPEGDKSRSTLPASQLIAPWKDFGSFQTPTERRRQTFNSFKLMSPDPPKTPNSSSPKQNKHFSRQKDGQLSKALLGYVSPPKWTSKETSYYNSAKIASTFATSSKKRAEYIHGKSMTGLTLPGRQTSDLHANQILSHTSAGGSQPKKFMVVSPNFESANVQSNKSLLVAKGSFNQPGGVWDNILQTNSIPLPPSKRLEQVRQMNYFIHEHFRVNDGSGTRFEGRDHRNQGQRMSGMQGRSNQGLSGPVETTSSLSHANPKQNKIPKHQPPVHVPGPKRENIYIGNYDGSDSDTDHETTKKSSRH